MERLAKSNTEVQSTLGIIVASTNQLDLNETPSVVSSSTLIPKNEQLNEDVLHKLDEPSLSKLVRDENDGKLKRICREASDARSPSSTGPEFMSLEEATSAAYGSARNTDIGCAAEKMNTNGVSARFAYYYDTQGIPIYGNVRNSTRVERLPPLKTMDIKVESDKLIGKEHSGSLIWENLEVTNSDHAKLLQKLKEHAKQLSNR